MNNSSPKLGSFANSYEIAADLCHLVKGAVVKQLPSGKWTVVSLKGKPLGEYKTKQEAVKRLRQIEHFKSHKVASDKSYSSIMRDLKDDKDAATQFQIAFKRVFDEACETSKDDPEKVALEAAITILPNIKETMQKAASAIELGNPEYAGKYLADIVKFLMRRISTERRQKSIDSLRQKIYYMNEYNMAAKRVPASSAMGQSITLLKHILLEHPPQYIRSVLNSVVKHL
jgi:transcription termination factor NusB